MTLQADLAALQADAATWNDVSLILSAAATAATDLTLTAGALSFAAEDTGLVETYQAYCTFVATRLTEGRDNTAEMGGGLLQVKAAFEGAEGSTSNSFDNLWDAVSE